MKPLVDFFHEASMLKQTKRSGWWTININNPESVADHSFRAAIIGYCLAKLEGADENKVLKMCTFHDMHESRILDMNKVTRRYINGKEAEKKSIIEQTESLPSLIRDDIRSFLFEMEDDSSKEARIAKDADYLECAFQAKEYIDIGYKDASDWMENIGKRLVTDSAKMLFKEMSEGSSSDWWKGLKNLEKREN